MFARRRPAAGQVADVGRPGTCPNLRRRRSPLMHQTVTPGYVPAMRRWYPCVSSTGYPTKLLFETCRHAAHHAAGRADREGGEVVVVLPGGEVRRKTFDRTGRDNGLRVVGADLL